MKRKEAQSVRHLKAGGREGGRGSGGRGGGLPLPPAGMTGRPACVRRAQLLGCLLSVGLKSYRKCEVLGEGLMESFVDLG